VATTRPQRLTPPLHRPHALHARISRIWVARGSNVSGLHLQLTGILGCVRAAATFLIFGSLSGTLCERSGVVNIAIEGQFMMGRCPSVMVASA